MAIPEGQNIVSDAVEGSEPVPFLKCPECDAAFFRGNYETPTGALRMMLDWAQEEYRRHYLREHGDV